MTTSRISTLRRRIRRTAAAVAVVGSVGAGVASPAGADLPLGIIDLTRVYKGADGSLLYTRSVGLKVVGFGEKSGSLAFVFDGTRVGDSVVGQWWDLPEAKRAWTGDLSLSIGAGGDSLKRSGGDDPGPDSWTAISKTEADYLSAQPPARFQSIKADDLDGAFDGTDASRAYVREFGGNVVWVGEQARRGSLPSATTAFIGKRISPTTVTGSFYDLPIGDRSKHGTFNAYEDATRNVTAINLDATTAQLFSVRYTPDYAVDFTRFAQEVEERFDGNVVGYGYAIGHKGQVVRSGAGGSRDLAGQPGDGPDDVDLPFEVETENEIASTTKTVTAVAVARALEQRGLSLDTKVDPYLPSQWARGKDMTTVTFRQLLHHDGLQHPGGICKTDPYQCLRDAVAAGMTATPAYNNIHYTVMRVILPFIVDGPDMQAAFESNDVDDDGAALNEIFSQSFRTYVRQMLADQGISADFAFQSDNIAKRYSFGPPPSGESLPDDSDDYLFAGSGALKITAPAYARFLARFDEGQFVSAAMVKAMKDGSLGFDQLTQPFMGSEALGPLHTKNGGAGGVASQLLIAPSRVQVFVTLTGSGLQTGMATLLRQSYEEALI